MLKKCFSFLTALLMISVLTFLLTKLSSSNPAENYLRISRIAITPEALEQAREYLGLDKSWLEQYLSWLQKAFLGDFGISYLWKVPVLPLVLESFLSTFYLGLVSFLLILVISLPLGILSGIYKDSYFDRIVQFFSFASVSMPSFWLGYLLILLFAVHLKWLPVSGKAGFTSVLLPSITLSFSLIGQYTALVRKAINEQLTSLHVENARLRGVKIWFIIKHHLLPNAMPALATGLSLTYIYLLTGSLIVEEVFAWNGIGSVFVHSLQAVDIPVIQACMLLFGFLFLLNNLVNQHFIRRIDPRVRKKERSAHE
ncbi:ABC transporter permease [Streptococcus merionis]|uniref:Nickel or oligopeptide transport system permease protein n=1 Tax=Streptococcus merionis TaxID=400065 RepID=A0A239SN03_9STRE|nr:ABC transporter permease [Streptococcus merionis]SNU86800.1 nickel or oligopeptide transport system permease protein [Streptococcus merionis]